MNGSRASAFRAIVPLGIVASVVLAAPTFAPSFVVFESIYAGAYAIAILGLIILTGYNGQISLGHGAFVAVGAYTVAIGAHHAGLSLWACVPLAAAIAACLGTAVGFVALRLSGAYLALATFSLAVAVPPLLKRFGALTGGSQGITLAAVASERTLYYVTWTIFAALAALAAYALSGRLGRSLRAIRDNEIAAISFGIDPTRYKTLAFAWSAAYAGIAGALLASATAYVGPDSYTLALSITLLVGAVLGGLDRLWGAIAGGFVVEFLPLWAQAINPAASSIIYGIALIVVAMAVPGGIAGAVAIAIAYPARRALARAASPNNLTMEESMKSR